MSEDFGIISPSGALTLFTDFNRQFPGRLFVFDPIDTGPTGDDFAVRGFDPVTSLNFDFHVTADGSISSFAFFPNQPNPFTEPPAQDPRPDTFDFFDFGPLYAPPAAQTVSYDNSFTAFYQPVDLFYGTSFFSGSGYGHGYGSNFGYGGGGADRHPSHTSAFTEDIEDQVNYGFDEPIY